MKLYYSPASTAMACHAALEEAGAEYEAHLVDIDAPRETRDPEFLRLSPHAQVPVLTDGEAVIVEGAAIMIYIGDRFPGAGLAPAVGDRRRGAYLQWLVYMADTLQVAMQMFFMPDRHTIDPQAHEGVIAKSLERLDVSWRLLDAACAHPGPYLLGERFSGCDLHLQMLTTWHLDQHAMLARYPHVKRCVEHVERRPAVRRILEVHGPDWVTHHPGYPGPP